MRAEQRDDRRRPKTGPLSRHRMRGQEFRRRHQYRGGEASAEPRGVAEVVWMEMGGNDPRQRLIVERRGEMRSPQVARSMIAVATIDLRPAVAIGQQPQVDMV